ncbi:hypothetical protein SAMN04490243_0782 [Robiginitalea myxolifaciens]|uniref:Tellurite resistance protein TerB n=1 Tax=Robiginitalea myxolifaciens TaxID=400055 RepID=A0A1I6FW21_9FLAO|nr:hypothetical protein [Robiginitalea myxolifaciens]SFR34120.1 hypothetical protein SAMN04490243_0782 [Robiginitalea myxolifaciens]
MQYNLAEQLAVLKAIDEIILSDATVAPGEIEFIKQLASVMRFKVDLIPQAREVEAEEAMAILKAMPGRKKRALAVMLNEAASSDGRVDEKELELIYGIFGQVGIDVDRI